MKPSKNADKVATQDVNDNDYQLNAEFSEVTDHDSQSANDTTQSDDNQHLNSPELPRSTKKPSFYGQEYSNIHTYVKFQNHQCVTRKPMLDQTKKNGKLL